MSRATGSCAAYFRVSAAEISSSPRRRWTTCCDCSAPIPAFGNKKRCATCDDKIRRVRIVASNRRRAAKRATGSSSG